MAGIDVVEGQGADHRYDVIVVDGDRSLAETVGTMLEPRYRVAVTNTPTNVLKWLHQRNVDVVVSAWKMPTMDGMTLFRQMRRLYQPTGFLLMTSHLEEFRHEVSPEERRLLGFIVKPFVPDQLFERVDQLARLAQMKRSVRMLRPVVPAR